MNVARLPAWPPISIGRLAELVVSEKFDDLADHLGVFDAERLGRLHLLLFNALGQLPLGSWQRPVIERLQHEVIGCIASIQAQPFYARLLNEVV